MFVNLPIRPSLIATWSQRWVAGHESWPLAREGSDSGVTLGPPKLAFIGVSRIDLVTVEKHPNSDSLILKDPVFVMYFAWFTKMVSGFVSIAFMQHSETQIRPWKLSFPMKGTAELEPFFSTCLDGWELNSPQPLTPEMRDVKVLVNCENP